MSEQSMENSAGTTVGYPKVGGEVEHENLARFFVGSSTGVVTLVAAGDTDRFHPAD